MTTLETDLRAMFVRVADSEPVPPLPSSVVDDGDVSALAEMFDRPKPALERGTRQPRRRRPLAAIAALAVVGSALSIAAASGLSVLPNSLTSALGWTPEPGAINAYSQTTRELFTEPGPNGKTLHLYFADATDNSYCVSLSTAVESGDIVNDPDGGADDEGGGCGGTIGDRYWNTFGGQSFTSSGSNSGATFILRAAGAATVRLQFDDGTSRALPVADGFTAGWFTVREKALHPVLVGFAADGSEVGRFTSFG